VPLVSGQRRERSPQKLQLFAQPRLVGQTPLEFGMFVLIERPAEISNQLVAHKCKRQS
jgi:hypothetical protein